MRFPAGAGGFRLLPAEYLYMPKLTEICVRALPQSSSGTQKYPDPEASGLGLLVGMRTMTSFFKQDMGGKTERTPAGRHPTPLAQVPRQMALDYALEWARGGGAGG